MPLRMLLVMSVMLTTGRLQAGGGPENVALVVNAESWSSRAIANHYQHLRKIPSSNVIYLSELDDLEQVPVEVFREKILKPVIETIARRGLAGQIDYVVYSADLPWGIAIASDLEGEKVHQVITKTAAINGLTYLYGYVLAKNPGYVRLDVNRYMRRPVTEIAALALNDEQREQLAQADKLQGLKEWAQAEELLAKLAAQQVLPAQVHYALARCRAELEKPELALQSLAQAVKSGFSKAQLLQRDPALASLRELDGFEELLKQVEQAKFEIQPTLGFHGRYHFDEAGELAAVGERYLLSTMLGVTTGRGNSTREVLDYLSRSAAADGTRPQGTIYYVTNGDVRSRTRQRVFPAAVHRLKQLGVPAEIVTGSTPKNQLDVLGTMMGTASFNWSGSGSRILPGAICDHLTSFGGVLRERAGQTPLTEFLRHGAAGASGTVTEPYAIQAKFPLAFIHAHYAQGCSLAEAFYQSVQGPYQLLIVGDPLCQPFARIPEISVAGLPAGKPVRGDLVLWPKCETPEVTIERFELFIDGRRVQQCDRGGSFEVDTRPLADGYHELRVVGIAEGPIATQGRWIQPTAVWNHAAPAKRPDVAETVAWEQSLRLPLAQPGARRIAVFHNGRELAAVDGAEGTVTLEARRLGPGPVNLEVAALVAADDEVRVVRWLPISFNVAAPRMLPALKAPAGRTRVAGLLFQQGDAEAVVVSDSRPADWLKQAGAAAEKTFELSGYFDVPADETYQFHLRTNCDVRLEVDDEAIEIPAGSTWRIAPVSLAQGAHHLRLRGKLSASPRLQIRFGGPGCQSLEGKQFTHLLTGQRGPTGPARPSE